MNIMTNNRIPEGKIGKLVFSMQATMLAFGSYFEFKCILN